MDMWEIYRKNLRFARKHFKITQDDIASATGITRSAYQHYETKGNGGSFSKIALFWLHNYGITPNDLLLRELTSQDLQKSHRIIKLKVRKSKKGC